MFLNYILYILIFCLISFLWCLSGVLCTYFLQNEFLAKELFISYVIHFNGIIIFGFGYGLLWFIKSSYSAAFSNLLNILSIEEDIQIQIQKSFSKIQYPIRNNLISGFITIIGGIILWKCGYPLEGFSKYFLAVTSISMFYVGGRLFSYLIGTIFLFKKFDLHQSEIKIQKNVNLLEFENLNSYLSVVFLGGIAALYFAFRGTLTANFTYILGTNFHPLLAYPIVIFLPFVLFSIFYIRYILNKIQKRQIFERIHNLNEIISKQPKEMNVKEILDMEKTILDIKEKLLSQLNSFYLFKIKDSPSIIISVILLFQFIYQNDNMIRKFIKSIINF